jgi:hypothetical protein
MTAFVSCQVLATAVIVFYLVRQSPPESSPTASPPSNTTSPIEMSIVETAKLQKAVAEAKRLTKIDEGRPFGANDVPEAIERGMMLDAVERRVPLIDVRNSEVTTTSQFKLAPGVLK